MSVPAEIGLHDRVGSWLTRLCDGLALIGGAFMVVAMLALVAHVIGNALGAPILGVTEIVERLIGASIFCFLAPCQLKGANIVVDYFSKPLPGWMRNWSDVLVTLIFALVAAVLTWRLGVGGLSPEGREPGEVGPERGAVAQDVLLAVDADLLGRAQAGASGEQRAVQGAEPADHRHELGPPVFRERRAHGGQA